MKKYLYLLLPFVLVLLISCGKDVEIQRKETFIRVLQYIEEDKTGSIQDLLIFPVSEHYMFFNLDYPRARKLLNEAVFNENTLIDKVYINDSLYSSALIPLDYYCCDFYNSSNDSIGTIYMSFGEREYETMILNIFVHYDDPNIPEILLEIPEE